LIHINERSRSRWFTEINSNGPRRYSVTISVRPHRRVVRPDLQGSQRRLRNIVNRKDNAVTIRDIKAHLVGGGIGSLAAAAFMIRDGGVPGSNITIYEALDVLGGSLDAALEAPRPDTACAADGC
jgi:MCRA family